MKTPLLPLLLLLSAPAALLAQTAPAAKTHQPTTAPTRLRGTVREAAGQPLPGVNVFLKGTFDGASTDSLGRFDFRTIGAAGPAVLVVSFVGYVPQEVLVNLGESPVSLPNIRLKQNPAALGDVVVTAGAFEASDSKRGTLLKPLDIVTTAGALGD
ncbi:carboxypeptidase-like regulatory domain-containing protein, partial [Hymenobacter agri]